MVWTTLAMLKTFCCNLQICLVPQKWLSLIWPLSEDCYLWRKTEGHNKLTVYVNGKILIPFKRVSVFSNRVHGIVLSLRFPLALKLCSSPFPCTWYSTSEWGISLLIQIIHTLLPTSFLWVSSSLCEISDITWDVSWGSMCKRLWSILQSFCPSTATLKINGVAFCNHVNYWLKINDSDWNLGKPIKMSSVTFNLFFTVHGLQQDLVHKYNRNFIP